MIKRGLEKIKTVYMRLLIILIVTLVTLLAIPLFLDVKVVIGEAQASFSPVEVPSNNDYATSIDPQISFGEYQFGTNNTVATVPLQSDKELKGEKILDLKLIEKGRFYMYEMKITGSNNGTSYQNVSLSDKNGNTITRKFAVVGKSNTENSIPEYPNAVVVPEGNDLMAIVDKQHKLSPDFVPSDLVYLPDHKVPTTTGGWLRRVTINDIKAMTDAMKAQGMDITVSSAYRSYNTQVSTYNMWVRYNGGSYAEADRISARPGHSEHQLGTTVDFINSETNYRLTTAFGTTRAGKWLAQNSYKYGFALSYPEGKESTTGYSYEPWHFRYIGKENALRWRESGLTLNEFLKQYEDSN